MCERDYFWNSSTISRILILVKKNCKISGFEDFLNTKKNKCSINTNKYYNTSMCACEIKNNSKKIIGDSVVKCDKTVDAVARS